MRVDSRRSFLKHVVAFGGATGVTAGRLRADGATATPIAKTTYGRVRGAPKDGVLLFKGIPYAGSPAGKNRFKAPPALKPWSGVRDALLYGPQSMQPADPMWPKDWKPAESSEECLFLNVWTPAVSDGRKRPVMFYSHGGGFASGNGGAEVTPQNLFHDGASLARDYDVVVVTHNHRLNIMGYLYLGELLGEEYAASGMAGMLDIAAALRWVHDNIENFGGDPGKVMIWGESGGGAKTSVLTAMPSVKGMFQRASVESGPALRMRTRESGTETARAVLAVFDLTRQDARKLVDIPAEQLMAVIGKLPRRPHASGSAFNALASELGFSPVVDGHYLPGHPYDPVAPSVSADVPMIVGYNRDETYWMHSRSPEMLSMDESGLQQRIGRILKDKADRVIEAYHRSRPNASPAELFIAITTAQWMGADAITMAERKAALKSAPVYMYVFAYDSEKPVAPGQPYHSATGHAAEMPFKFNHVNGSTAPEKKRAARNMSRAWAAFARNGDPSHDEIPQWPAYTVEERATMFLDAECRVIKDPWRQERLVWRDLD